MLTRKDIIEILRKENIDPSKVVFLGGSAMTMKGYIAETRDIDLMVDVDYVVKHTDVLDAYNTCPELMDREKDIDIVTINYINYRCQSDNSLLRFYRHMNRNKDQPKIRLMEKIIGLL